MSTDPLHSAWWQIDLTCTDDQAAEHMAATHLAPVLNFLEVTGVVFDWWFVRKPAALRPRVRPRIGSDDDLTTTLSATIAALTDRGTILRARESTYQPETDTFGGREAMPTAYALFHADSHHILTQPLLAEPSQRLERCLVRASRLLSAAGLDWQGQGNVWLQVATHRYFDIGGTEPADPLADVLHPMNFLISTDAALLRRAPRWIDAFETAGTRLADLASSGRLTGQLGAVLVQHLLAMLNRHGVPEGDQHRLALAAARTILDDVSRSHSSAPDDPLKQAAAMENGSGTEASGDQP
jgi:protein-L-isoaspartate(D-aspartate) O-methyltransferase